MVTRMARGDKKSEGCKRLRQQTSDFPTDIWMTLGWSSKNLVLPLRMLHKLSALFKT